MIKIFKKTFAFFIAVIMMISSFPYMTLAEDTASATEGSTPAEMTNEELKAYIDANIANASVKLPAQQTLADVPTEFHKGIVTEGSWKGPDTNQKFSSTNDPGLFIKFSLNGLGDAVAVYTGENNDICFPISAHLYSNIKNKEPKFDLYIKNISIPETQSNFQFGNTWWERCIGEKKLKDLTDGQQSKLHFSSESNGDRRNSNESFSSIQGKISWRNYIKYTGSGNTDSYYEKLPTTFQFKLVYQCNNPDLNKRYTETKDLPLDHCMYVLNMKPYKDIVKKLKTDYDAVESDESKYTQKALNNYYKAVRDIIDFDIKTLLSNMTLNKPKVFSKEIAEIATKVKNVVENYKESLLDFTAYNSAKEKCDTIINNQNENVEYESNSFAEFEKVYKDVIVKVENVETQEALDDLTAQLITAQTMLRKNKFTIRFIIYKNENSEPSYDHSEDDYVYGQRYQFDTEINPTKECVKRWVIYTDDHKTRTVVGTTDSIFALYATKDATIEAYVVPLEENVNPEEYSKVVFYGFNGRVIDVQYLKKGDELTSVKYTNPPNVPFYKFESWDKNSVTGNGNEIAVKAKYTPKQAETDGCTVHYNGFVGGKKTYSYDELVSLVGAKNDEYFALATTVDGKNADGSSILTYLNRNEFHAPKRSEIYVVPVNKEDRVAKVAITGNYATKVNDKGEIVSEADATKNRAVFNCKFYLPDGCKLVEWGAQISANGKTKAVKGEKLSKYNEYSIYMNVSKNSTSVKAFTAVAYVRYKDSNDKIKTIYSQSVEQAFE